MQDQSDKRTFVRLSKYLSQHKFRIIAGIFCTTLMGLADVLQVNFLSWLVDGLTQIDDTSNISVTIRPEIFGKEFTNYVILGSDAALAALKLLGIFIISLVVFKGICVYAKEYLMSSVVQKVVKELRDKLYSRLLRLKIAFFEKGKTGALMSRLTNDVQIIEHSLMSMVVVMQAGIHSIIFLAAMFYTDWKLTLFAIVIFPVAGVVVKIFSKAIRRVSSKILAKIADINAFLQESITAIKIVKTYNREQYEEKRFKEKTYQNYAFSMKANRIVAFLKPSNEIFSTIGMLAIILFSGYRIIEGQMDIAVFTKFALFMTMVYKPLKTLADSQPTIQRALASADRIFGLLDEKTEFKEIPYQSLNGNGLGAVSFDNVKFSYNGKDTVLNGLSFNVGAGETVALVGPSGVGKSTIINLLLKFYDYDSGKIIIDGVELKNLNPHDIRDMVSLVPQETILFSGSVKDNIKYGDLDATDEQVIEAARSANAHDFIMELPDKYETEIGERGAQISGGQRQRLAIARAVLKKPKILLFDEATSALDSESEALVQEATENLMKNRTAFVIAHRLSTVKNADKIIVMDKGKVAELGTHQELLKKSGLYKSLHDLQFR